MTATKGLQATYTEAGKAYERDAAYLPDRITRLPGRSQDPFTELGGGALEVPTWPAEPGRYRLVAARACPWANRAIIVRSLLGLDDVVSMGLCGPTHDNRSWTFDLDPGGVDPVLGYERLQQAYFARDPEYPRGITVPAMVDVATKAVVTNDFPWITHDLFFEWRDHHRPDAPDLWPDDVREEMESVMQRVYTEVNNGVYQCGFAGSQQAYEQAYDQLWAGLDWLEERLADRRYLMGPAITEADVRLFTTLVRFDPVYVAHFKCNRQRIADYPNLSNYLRDLYQVPGVAGTVSLDHIKRHYYQSHTNINPTGIVPKGPAIDYAAAHDRDRFAATAARRAG